MLNELTEQIKKMQGDIQKNSWEIGVRLKRIRDEALFKEHYGTFEKYLEEAVDIHRSTAYELIRIVETFDVASMQQLGVAKCRLLLSYVQNDVERKEWVKIIMEKNISVRSLEGCLKKVGKEDPLDDLRPSPGQAVLMGENGAHEAGDWERNGRQYIKTPIIRIVRLTDRFFGPSNQFRIPKGSLQFNYTEEIQEIDYVIKRLYIMKRYLQAWTCNKSMNNIGGGKNG